MINFPFKTITLNKDEFVIKDITHPNQYNFNSEFETHCLLPDLKKTYRIIQFKIPNDCEVLAKSYFRLSPINSDIGFWTYSTSEGIFSVICKYENWNLIDSIDFGYFYLTQELKDIQDRIKELEKEYNEEIAKLKK